MIMLSDRFSLQNHQRFSSGEGAAAKEQPRGRGGRASSRSKRSVTAASLSGFTRRYVPGTIDALLGTNVRIYVYTCRSLFDFPPFVGRRFHGVTLRGPQNCGSIRGIFRSPSLLPHPPPSANPVSLSLSLSLSLSNLAQLRTYFEKQRQSVLEKKREK
jgi:hypothetical protein